MKIKVSGVTSFREVKRVDGKADYITIPVGGTGARSVPLGTAKDLASIISSSSPVLGVRRSTITWTVDTARKMDFRIVEYMVPVPSISAAILAEMLEGYGIKLGTVIVWDRRWVPESPVHYSTSLLTLASNIEYIIIDSKSGNPPLSDLAEKRYDKFGVKYNIINKIPVPEDLCKYNINIVDIDSVDDSRIEYVINRIKGGANECKG